MENLQRHSANHSISNQFPKIIWFLLFWVGLFNPPNSLQAQSDLPKVVYQEESSSEYNFCGGSFFRKVTLDSIHSNDSNYFYSAYFSFGGDSVWELSPAYEYLGSFSINKAGDYAVRYPNSEQSYWKDTFYRLFNIYQGPDTQKIPAILNYKNDLGFDKIVLDTIIIIWYRRLKSPPAYFIFSNREGYLKGVGTFNDTVFISTLMPINYINYCVSKNYLFNYNCFRTIGIKGQYDTLYRYIIFPSYNYENDSSRDFYRLQIYPGPCSDFYRYIHTKDISKAPQFTITGRGIISSESNVHSIQLFEYTGKQRLEIKPHSQEREWDLTQHRIPPGFYIIKIKDEAGEWTGKISYQ